MQDVFARFVEAGSVVYDVGANVGFFTLCAARLAGLGGYVYAFEPDLVNASVARRNTLANDLANVCVYPVAVGARTGVIDLRLARYSGGHAIAEAAAPPDLVGTVPVPLMALDDFVKSADIRRPDFVKIDVEGAELAVLRGMAGLVSEARPVILVELDDASTCVHAAKVEELRSWMDAHRYSLERLEDSYDGGGYEVSHWVCQPA